MNHSFPRAFLVLLTLLSWSVHAAGTRLKDLVFISGARDNQLQGFGIVIGLAGDGDKDPVYTVNAMGNLLQKQGLNLGGGSFSSKNVAAVIVTADIPAFARPGSRLDVNVASIGDAKSLQGGVLIQTPLRGANGMTYAVAQGPLSVGGFSAGAGGGGGATVQKNHPTVALIPNGALVEKDIPAHLARENHIDLLLRQADFTSAARLAAAVNEKFPGLASAIDSTTVRVALPPNLAGSTVDFVARLEPIEMTPDSPARIVINERTGTIVANSRIKISSCAVSHGSLTIQIASTIDVSQPNPLSNTGTTVATPRTDTSVNESKMSLIPLPDLPTVEKVATHLNQLGVSPRDMMAIFQAMKQAGALQAELIIR